MDAMDTLEGNAASRHTGGVPLMSGGREVVPALGLAWANCVTMRIFLSRGNGARIGGMRCIVHPVAHPHASAIHQSLLH